MRTIPFRSQPRLPVHFYLARHDSGLLTLPLGAVAIVFSYAAVVVSGGMWIFGPVALLAATLAAWVYYSVADRTVIFSVTEAGISSKYWSFGLLPWSDIRSFELKEVYFDGMGMLCFLDFQLHDRGKYGRHMSNSHLIMARTDDVPLSIPLAFVDFNASKLQNLLRAQMDKALAAQPLEAVAA